MQDQEFNSDGGRRGGSDILLTGATGFVGKVVLYELLRRREELNLNKVRLLIRPGRASDAARRFRNEIAASKCFSGLDFEWQDFPGDIGRKRDRGFGRWGLRWGGFLCCAVCTITGVITSRYTQAEHDRPNQQVELSHNGLHYTFVDMSSNHPKVLLVLPSLIDGGEHKNHRAPASLIIKELR